MATSRARATVRRLTRRAAAVAVFYLSSSAAAQARTPAAPLPAATQPAPPVGPGYPYPPAPYGAYQAPLELPYLEGQPIPVGYHVRDEPRHGLVTAGYLLVFIPYGIGVAVAYGVDFKHDTEWLAVPFVGPWLTMGRRDYSGCRHSTDSSDRDSLACLGDVFVVMGLVADGVIQAGGGALLLVGYLATKRKLVRDDLALAITPRRIGTGFGIAASGTF